MFTRSELDLYYTFVGTQLPYPSDSEVDVSEWEWADPSIEDEVVRDGPAPHTPRGSILSLEAHDEHNGSVVLSENEERYDIASSHDIRSEVRGLCFIAIYVIAL